MYEPQPNRISFIIRAERVEYNSAGSVQSTSAEIEEFYHEALPRIERHIRDLLNAISISFVIQGDGKVKHDPDFEKTIYAEKIRKIEDFATKLFIESYGKKHRL